MILDSSLTAKEMRAVEMNAEYLGVPRLLLMENAGGAVARAVADTVDVKKKKVDIDRDYVKQQLQDILKDQDLRRFIL